MRYAAIRNAALTARRDAMSVAARAPALLLLGWHDATFALYVWPWYAADKHVPFVIYQWIAGKSGSDIIALVYQRRQLWVATELDDNTSAAD